MPGELTFELQVAFLGTLEARLATKRQVLSWLAENQVTTIAESMIDGIEVPLSAAFFEGPRTAGPADCEMVCDFAEEDAAPVMIWEFDPERLRAIDLGLAEIFSTSVKTSWRELKTEAWRQAWVEPQDQASSILRTRRFLVRKDQGATDGSMDHLQPIVLAPGEAFGDGRHATTEAALYALEALASKAGRNGFLDVGTGSGVLAIAAAFLGFEQIVATDIDQEILFEAERNAQLNGANITFINASYPPVGRTYDVIAANILAPVLHELLPHFKSLLAPGGALILAGFIEKETPALLKAAKTYGLEFFSEEVRRGWVGLILKHA